MICRYLTHRYPCSACEQGFTSILNTSLNKSWAWHIDGATDKNPHYFYKVLPFKWHEWKFEPHRIFSLQITVKWSYCCKFSNNGKIWISYVDKVLHSDRKNIVQAKKWLDKCYSSETMVKRWCADFKCGRTYTNDDERSGHLNSTVVPEKSKISRHSFWLIVN